MDYSQFITIDPEIRFGRATNKGTRIGVADVLGWLASGMSMEEISEDFPKLSADQIKAYLAFSADHRQKSKHD